MTYANANLLARTAADSLLAPLSALPDGAALSALALMAAAIGLTAFRWLTPQRRLRLLGDAMAAAVYEIRLFSRSPARVLRAQARLFALGLGSIGLALPAVVVTAPPLAALLARAELRLGPRPLRPGEEVLMKVELRRPAPPRETIAVEAPAGIAVRDPLVIVPAAGEVWIGLAARAPGDHEIRISAGGAVETKRVRVAPPGDSAPALLSPVRAGAADARIWRTSEPPLDASSPVAAIELEYPERDRAVPWWATVLLLSIGAALVLRRPFGVKL